MMKFQRMIRYTTLILLALCLVTAAAAETVTGLAGEWVYRDIPDVTVLTLNEDGTAYYAGTDLTWLDEGLDILLTDSEGAVFQLVYAIEGANMVVWLPSVYTRDAETGEAGSIVGTWKVGGDSLSSFVFREDGQFAEDDVFAGNYVIDPENGRITLQYQDGFFKDTVMLYALEGDTLLIEYPWVLTRR